MMVIRRTKSSAILHFPTRASEWATSIILLNWGLAIFATKGEILGGNLAKLLNLMSPTKWAILFTSIGLIRLLLLIINGSLKRSSHYRAVFSFISCFIWFQVVYTFAVSDVISTALTVYPVLLVLDFYNAYRTTAEARITDEGYKDVGRS